MLKLFALVALTQPGPPKPPTPHDAVIEAERDMAGIFKKDPAEAANTRYFTAHHIADRPDSLDGEFAAFSLHCNLLSRGPKIVLPRQVTPWLWAVDASKYKWDLGVFGKLADADTWMHALLVDEKTRKTTVSVAIPPWLPEKEFRQLNEYAQSKKTAALFRYDYFMNRTAIVEDRDGFSYYEFLGVKNEKDAAALAQLDVAKAELAFRELAAVVRRSGVGIRNRQIFRYATILGAWWETRDPDSAIRDSNALNRKFKQFVFKGKEVIFTLPNGLPAFFLFNDKGELAKSGPPQLVSDQTTADTDARVHPYVGCVRCHLSGALKPIDDYTRRVFATNRGPVLGAANVPDPDHPELTFSERVESAYLGDLSKWFKRDESDFAAAYADATGLKAAQVPALVAKAWARYEDADLSVSEYARELGVPHNTLRGALIWRAKEKRDLDETLAGFAQPDPRRDEPLRREHSEEAVFFVYETIALYQQAGKPDEPHFADPVAIPPAATVPVAPADPAARVHPVGGSVPARAGRAPGVPSAGRRRPGGRGPVHVRDVHGPAEGSGEAGRTAGKATQIPTVVAGREDSAGGLGGFQGGCPGEVPELPRPGARGRSRRRVRPAGGAIRAVRGEADGAGVEGESPEDAPRRKRSADRPGV